MSFDNFFRNFWGSPGPFGSNDEWPDDEPNIPPNSRHDPFQDESDEMMKHFERHFQNVFKSFGFMDFGGPMERFEDAHTALPPPTELPLRDKLLKEPDSRQNALVPRGEPRYENPRGWFHNWFQRTPLEDRDLDEDVSSKGIDSLLKESPDLEPRQTEPRSSSFFSSSSVTIRSADGKIEQRYSKKDSLGNEETVVKRQLGDKSHSVVVRKDSKGVEEEENFENMDDKNLEDFNREWNANKQHYLPYTNRQRDPEEHTSSDPSSRGMYQRLFRNFLPQPKDER